MSTVSASPVSIEDIRAAAARLAPYLLPTPLSECGWLSDVARTEVFVKWESLQSTGSFKLRGALNKLLLLRARGVERVLCVSAGNHGLGVAQAARRVGMQATVVVPESAAPTKVAAIRRLGAELIVRGADYDQAEIAARRLAEERAVEFVSPYNDAGVIAGQATLALDVLERTPASASRRGFDSLIVPVGGGGLIAGAALCAAAISPGTQIVGAQPRNAPAMHAALRAGHIVPVAEQPTCADGLAGNIEAGAITVPIVVEHVARIALVEEASIEAAIRGFLAHDHQVVEGSGAVGAAALLEGLANASPAPAERLCVLVTGRNLDVARLEAILARTRTPIQ